MRGWLSRGKEVLKAMTVSRNALLVALITISLFSAGCDKLWYAGLYSTSPGNVNVENRPTDCDFLYAPMGLKSCHYEKQVITERDAVSTEGVKIVSEDGGPWYPSRPAPYATIPDQKTVVLHVYVRWTKKED